MSRSLRERLRGPWRVAVTEGSMAPAILPGDWLIVNPLVGRWPPPGSVVVFREPLGDTLAIKRVVGRGGDRVRFADGYLTLAPDEAWLTADADEKAAAAVGFGPPIDSARFGPVGEEGLVGRALFRYAPLRRIGRIRRRADR
jgi:signal peptidase I